MILVIILMLMALMITVGRKSKQFSRKQYLTAAFVALLQTGIALFYMFTMEKPPMF